MKNLNDAKKIFVAGHNGMVGSAISHQLEKDPGNKIIKKSRNQLDLTNQSAVRDFFQNEKPNEVYLAAAKVGGILANSKYPADFIAQNLSIQLNVIQSAFDSGIKKLLFLGSSCIYPKFVPHPIKEKDLLSGPLEPTNEPYAIAKIAGIKLCESFNRQYGKSHNIDYRCLMPTNLYGPGDTYDDQNSHVIPALIKRIHEAKVNNIDNVEIWGTGNAKREFLHVRDLALAAIYIMNLPKSVIDKYTNNSCSQINVGYGEDVTIKDLAITISEIIQYKGKLKFDLSKPDGTPRKLMDNTIMKELGWTPKINLKKGLQNTYENYKDNLYLK
tara:strand:- start:2041 stop:3024 length:984 start_codon:yes stop_codon:yes gene_type:complete